MEKLWRKREIVCAGGGGVGKIYVLVGGIFICFFLNGTERRAFGKERENFFRSGLLLIVEREEGKIIFSEKLLRHPHPSHSPRNIFLAVV